MLQTLERRRKYIGVILPDERTPKQQNNLHKLQKNDDFQV